MKALAIGAVIFIVIVLAVLYLRGSTLTSALTQPTIVVTDANKVFAYYHLNNKLHSVNVPPGNYTPTTLAVALASALNNDEPGWTISWNPTTKLYTITNNNFSWERCNSGNTIFALMGLDPTANCGTSWKNTETSITPT